MNAQTDALARAIEVEPGRYVRKTATRDGSYWEAFSVEVFADGTWRQFGEIKLPGWWMPEQRFVWRVGDAIFSEAEAEEGFVRLEYARTGVRPTRLSVNYQTGEEVRT